MRSPSSSCLALILCLLSSSYALPFLYHEEPHLVQPRAKYSVVAVDGSTHENSNPGDSSPPVAGNTNVQPEIQIRTITATPSSPPVSVVTLVATKLVQPVPPPKDDGNAKANVAIINVDAVQPSSSASAPSIASTPSSSPAMTTPVSTKSSSSSLAPPSVASSTASPVIVPTSTTQTSSLTTTFSSTANSVPPSPSPTPVQWDAKYNIYSPPPIITSSSTSRTYDDGLWHTTYRIWNATSLNNPPTQPTASNVLIL